MNKKRNIWIVGGAVLLLVVLVSAFVIMQPSAKDILTQTIETAKTNEDGHADVNINVDSPEEKVSATVEVWGVHAEDGPSTFRMEVLETDREEAVGAVIVSGGETVWAYSPAKNTVFMTKHWLDLPKNPYGKMYLKLVHKPQNLIEL